MDPFPDSPGEGAAYGRTMARGFGTLKERARLKPGQNSSQQSHSMARRKTGTEYYSGRRHTILDSSIPFPSTRMQVGR